jgi:hypothetical protein
LGGWNASPPNSPGRLALDVDIEDSQAVVDYLLSEHKKSIDHDWQLKLNQLKIENYDLTKKIEELKESLDFSKKLIKEKDAELVSFCLKAVDK